MGDNKKLVVGLLVSLMCASNMVHTSFAQTQNQNKTNEIERTEQISNVDESRLNEITGHKNELALRWAIENELLEKDKEIKPDDKATSREIHRMLMEGFRPGEYANNPTKESFESFFGKDNYSEYITLRSGTPGNPWMSVGGISPTRDRIIDVIVDEMNWPTYPDDSKSYEYMEANYSYAEERIYNSLQAAVRAGLLTDEQIRNKEWTNDMPTKAELAQLIYDVKHGNFDHENVNKRDNIIGKYNIWSYEVERSTDKVREIEKELDFIGESWTNKFFEDGWHIEIINSIDEVYEYDKHIVGLCSYSKKKLVFNTEQKRGTTYHEFGHYTQDAIGNDIKISDRNFNKYCSYLYDKEMGNFAPSQYSKTNYREWFAECYEYALNVLEYKDKNTEKYEKALASFSEKAPLMKELLMDNILTYNGLYDVDSIDAKVDKFVEQNPHYKIPTN